MNRIIRLHPLQEVNSVLLKQYYCLDYLLCIFITIPLRVCATLRIAILKLTTLYQLDKQVKNTCG